MVWIPNAFAASIFRLLSSINNESSGTKENLFKVVSYISGKGFRVFSVHETTIPSNQCKNSKRFKAIGKVSALQLVNATTR